MAEQGAPLVPEGRTLAVIGEVLGVVRDLRDVSGRAVVPVWLIPVAAILTAIAVVLARRIDLGALFAAWARATTPPPPNTSPPIPMPEGGATLDQKPPEDWT